MKKLLIMLVCAVSLTACAEKPPSHEEVMDWGRNCLRSINTVAEQGFVGDEEGQRGLEQCMSFAEVWFLAFLSKVVCKLRRI